jgi:hypothetical protein
VTSGHRPAGVGPAGRSPAHGFCDDEVTRRLLRSRPPRQALAWAAVQLGGTVISARALRGGMSSAVHLLTTQYAGGQRRQAVLRRYVRPEVTAEPQTCRVLMEARALAAHEPAIAAAVRAADARTHQQLEGLIAAGVRAGEWPDGTDPALAARLFTAGLYGLMAQWHLAPGSFSWDAAATALAGGPAPDADGDAARQPRASKPPAVPAT